MFVPQNFAKALSSNLSCDDCNYPGEMKKKNKGYAKFWGVNMVYHGRCANGKFFCFGMTLKSNECHATVDWNVCVLHKGTPGSMTPFVYLIRRKENCSQITTLAAMQLKLEYKTICSKKKDSSLPQNSFSFDTL